MSEVAGRLNGFEVKYITDAADFNEAILKLEKADALALDLEFDDNRYTYGLNLCLIQIADLNTCYLIDPFTVPDLQPLWNIIADEKIVKIIHSASNDIILLKILGCTPQHILDTELAAKVLNYGRTSFANMMAEVSGIEIDKSYQVSNWTLRPLQKEQLLYAALDVVYLHGLKDSLVAEITKLGRLHWLDEECRLLEQIEQKDQAVRYMKLKGADRLNYYELYILKDLYDFREEVALKLNKPSGMVVPTEVMLQLATGSVPEYKDWQSTKGLMGRIKDHKSFQEFREVLVNAHQEAKAKRISTNRPVRERRPDFVFTREEVDQRKIYLAPLRNYLSEVYGEYATSLLLSQSSINDYAEGKPFLIKKSYAIPLVKEAIDHLRLEINLD